MVAKRKKIKNLSGSTNREKQMVVTSLRQIKRFKLNDLLALTQHRGTMIHSDCDFYYQTPMFINMLKDFGMTQHMNRQSTTVDHALIESFFHTLKSNIVHNKQYEFFHNFKIVLDAFAFINYYNNQRVKQKLNGLSPVKYRQLTTEYVS